MSLEKVAYALQLVAEPDHSMSSIAKLLGVSRSTLYKALPELVAPRSGRLLASLTRSEIS